MENQLLEQYVDVLDYLKHTNEILNIEVCDCSLDVWLNHTLCSYEILDICNLGYKLYIMPSSSSDCCLYVSIMKIFKR